MTCFLTTIIVSMPRPSNLINNARINNLATGGPPSNLPKDESTGYIFLQDSTGSFSDIHISAAWVAQVINFLPNKNVTIAHYRDIWDYIELQPDDESDSPGLDEPAFSTFGHYGIDILAGSKTVAIEALESFAALQSLVDVPLDHPLRAWIPFGGGDSDEAQWYALWQLANFFQGPLSIVLIGDSALHDPICEADLVTLGLPAPGEEIISQELNGIIVTSLLQEKRMRVFCLSWFDGMDGIPASDGGDYSCPSTITEIGAGTNLSKNTGGKYFTAHPPPDEILALPDPETFANLIK